MCPSLEELEETEEYQEGKAVGNSNVFKFHAVSRKWDQVLPLTKTQRLQQAWNQKILTRFQRNHKSGKFPFPIVWLYNTQYCMILEPKCTVMYNKIVITFRAPNSIFLDSNFYEKLWFRFITDFGEFCNKYKEYISEPHK